LKTQTKWIDGVCLTGGEPTLNKELPDFIRKLKKQHPDKPIVVGGPHATFEHESCFRSAPVDFIVMGEGEETIVDLLDALSGCGDIGRVKGIAYVDPNGKIKATEPRGPLDIDRIPWPARHLLPMEHYFRNRPRQYFMRSPVASILTSRACPYSCVFCSTTVFWGRRWRGRDPENVVDEMAFLQREYGVREIIVQDDNFLANPRRVERLCDEIMRRELDIRWQVPPGVSVWLLNEALLRKLRDAGLYIIRPQIETGNPKTLKYIRKKVNLKKAKHVVRLANKLGLWTQTNMIIGFYFETGRDIYNTIRYAENLGVDNVGYNIALPYTHTAMFDDYLREGLVRRGEPLRDSYDTRHFSAEDLKRIRTRAQKRYPWVRLRQLLNPMTFLREFLPKVGSSEKLFFLLRRIAKLY
jgi:radical SAM superfamily enzyme YgiQ (UPF0313 family)